MRFAARYEILRALTRGAVETFAARDKSSGEQVLAHIYECAEPPEDQPTVNWMLTCFSKIAPEPLGTIIDAGGYDVLSFAYIVIRWPGEDAVQGWIARYKSSSAPIAADAAPGSASDERLTSAAPSPVNAAMYNGTSHKASRPDVPIPSTQLHDASLSKTSSTFDVIATSPEPQRHAAEPGEFTRQFFPEAKSFGTATNGYGSADANPTADEDMGSPLVGRKSEVDVTGQPGSTAGREIGSWLSEEAKGFTKLFNPEARAASPTLEPSSDSDRSGRPATGEFTKIFRGTPGREPSSDSSYQDAAAKYSSIGGFTEFFGPAESKRSETARGSVTEFLEKARSGEAHDATEPRFPEDSDMPVTDGRLAKRPRHSPTEDGSCEPASRAAFSPKAGEDSAPPYGGDTGATGIFAPGLTGMPFDSGAAAGPSPYTQFITKSSLPTAESEPADDASSGAAPGSDPGMPGMPGFTAVAKPAPPGFPLAAPPASVPAVPTLAPPAVPAPLAGAGEDEKPAFPYWPLIVIFVLLFIIAALVVVYFMHKR